MKELRAGTPAGSGSKEPTGVTAESAAWWLSIGEADPALVSRFLYGPPDDVRRRAYIAARMGRLIDAAEVVGISDTLAGTLTDLFR